ncbi:MAG TPA: ATP-binding protein [Anaeromyxobacteraceae bacterium]|nr:ATP-binding protein [Anaeromyxobacteraceae bacterium]
MIEDAFRLDYVACRDVLAERLAEPAPGRIQLLAGPRQVGKTTLLLELADRIGPGAVYAAADSPEASLPGFWERTLERAEGAAAEGGKAVLFVDEVHLLHGWSARLKGAWDHLRRRRIPVHVVATGSSALHVGAGSRESLAGRFERLTLIHWSAASLAAGFGLDPREAAELLVRVGSYPGAFPLRGDRARWAAYVRDAILEPAVGRDLLALAAVRRPSLLRQVFAVAATSPAQVVSLQKIQGRLQDPGALETIQHYLALLEEAFLVAPLPRYSARDARRRAAPPKLVTLNNALVAVMDPRGPADPGTDAARFGTWLENACLAHAWSSGQRVSYWREEPHEVDAVLEGGWGAWAIEVKSGPFRAGEIAGLLEFVRRHRSFRPLVVGDAEGRGPAERAGVRWIDWRDFLVGGPAGAA